MKTPFNDDPKMYFYYLRDEGRQIFGGACLKKIDDKWCRGISLLSSLDKFDKNLSKKIARSRLMKAVFAKQNSYPIHRTKSPCNKLYMNYPHINKIGFQEFGYKSRYDAELTEEEKRIVAEPF